MDIHLPLFETAKWSPPARFPDLSDAKLISIDLETCDPELKERGPGGVRGLGHIAGVAVATDTGFCGYYPVRHVMGGNLDRDTVFDWLKDVLKLPVPKVAANWLYDLEWLWAEGFKLTGPFYDIQIAEPLLDEEKMTGYSLNVLAKEYLGQGKDEETLNNSALDYGVDPKGGLHILPAKCVGQYAEADARLTLEIFNIQKQKLIDQGLWSIFELETRILPLALAMRFKGVRINEEAALRVQKKWEEREETLLRRIKSIAGFAVNPWSPDDLARVCREKHIPHPRTKLGKPSFTKKWFEQEAASAHEFFKVLAQYRSINKLCTMFVRQQIIGNVHNGRIHGQFHPLRGDGHGTRTGRFSGSDPNLQNIPNRAEDAKEIRSLFVPEADKIWGKLDYSQQEPRLLVHYAALCGCTGADAARFKYVDDPRADFYKFVVELAGITRHQAKTIWLARSYGMGLGKLANDLGVSEDEAIELSNQMNNSVAFIKELSQDVQRVVQQRGHVITLAGRHRHFNYWEPTNWEVRKQEGNHPRLRDLAEARWPKMRLQRGHTHKALNALIQGSAADMTKIAMLKVHDELGLVPHIQVHDELNYSVENKEEAAEIKRCMETAVELQVPVFADLGLGPSWGETEK